MCLCNKTRCFILTDGLSSKVDNQVIKMIGLMEFCPQNRTTQILSCRDIRRLGFTMFCARLFICALWSPAGKGLTSWLSFVVSSVSLSLSHLYPGSGVVLDFIDS